MKESLNQGRKETEEGRQRKNSQAFLEEFEQCKKINGVEKGKREREREREREE